MANERINLKTIAWSLVALALAFILIMSLVIYATQFQNKFISYSEKLIPYPAAMVGYGKFISINELNENLASVKRFYEKQDFSQAGYRVDFSTEEGKKRLKLREKQILNKMIEDQAIEAIAADNKIRITGKMVDESVSRELAKYGTESDVKDNLKNLYGWSMDDFKEKIVRPNLYRAELEKVFFNQNNSNTKSKANIKAARKLLEEKEFDEVARKYSEGLTADKGGYIGWFLKDQLVPEVAEKIETMKKGEMSEIVESELGFHIVNLIDVKEENGEKLYELKQIFVRKMLFFEWLEENMKDMQILVFMPGYSWNDEINMAEFTSTEWRQFEEETMKNQESDPSLIF